MHGCAYVPKTHFSRFKTCLRCHRDAKDLDHGDLSHAERDLFEGTCIHGTVEQDQKGTKNRDSSVCDIVKSTHMHEQRYEIRLFSLFSHSV